MDQKEENDQLTEQIIGCCFRIHRSLGPGFPERVYQTALVNSLAAASLRVEKERRFTVVFEEKPLGDFRVDLLVEGRVILEVKAIIGPMPKIFGAQLLAYLKAAHMPVGLLVNFGNPSCEVKRSVLSSAKSERNLRNHKKSLLVDS